jgi:hypothetical protein
VNASFVQHAMKWPTAMYETRGAFRVSRKWSARG